MQPQNKNTSSQSKHLLTLLSVSLIAVVSFGSLVAILATRAVRAACPDLSNSYGSAVVSNISVPASATYHVWARVKTADLSANSFYLNVGDTNCGIVMGGSNSLGLNTWTWIDYRDGSPTTQVNLALSAGNYNLTVTGKDPNVAVDRFLLVPEGTSCVPTDLGDNCISPQSAVDINVSGLSEGQSVSGSVIVQATPVNTTTVSKIDFVIDNSLVASDTSAPYCLVASGSTCAGYDTSSLSNASHSLKLTMSYYNGQTLSKTISFSVNNPLASVKNGVFRLFLPSNGTYIYTLSTTERDTLAQQGYQNQGVVFNAFSSQQSGSVPVYHLFSKKTGDNYYTSSTFERDVATNFQGYQNLGTVFYDYNSLKTGSTAVYRLWSDKLHRHYYTTSSSEVSQLVATTSYRYQTIGFYASN